MKGKWAILFAEQEIEILSIGKLNKSLRIKGFVIDDRYLHGRYPLRIHE